MFKNEKIHYLKSSFCSAIDFNKFAKNLYIFFLKVCNGEGPEECRTIFESSCTTKYVEKQPGWKM